MDAYVCPSWAYAPGLPYLPSLRSFLFCHNKSYIHDTIHFPNKLWSTTWTLFALRKSLPYDLLHVYLFPHHPHFTPFNVFFFSFSFFTVNLFLNIFHSFLLCVLNISIKPLARCRIWVLHIFHFEDLPTYSKHVSSSISSIVISCDAAKE